MTTSTITLATPDLTIGMIVQTHGSRFLLTSLYHDEAAALLRAKNDASVEHSRNPDDVAAITRAWAINVTCRGFRTEYLGPVVRADGSTCESIPPSWRAEADGGWKIQGNHYAMWTVEA